MKIFSTYSFARGVALLVSICQYSLMLSYSLVVGTLKREILIFHRNFLLRLKNRTVCWSRIVFSCNYLTNKRKGNPQSKLFFIIFDAKIKNFSNKQQCLKYAAITHSYTRRLLYPHHSHLCMAILFLGQKSFCIFKWNCVKKIPCKIGSKQLLIAALDQMFLIIFSRYAFFNPAFTKIIVL